jgi:hypothetical protein
MPQTLLNPSFENWAYQEDEGGKAPVSWTRALAGSANLVTNGGFATNDLTSWTAAAGWAATTGKAVHTAGIADTTPLTQNISLTTAHHYLISVRISGRTAGTLSMGLENITTGPFAIGGYAEATYEVEVIANATDATSLLSFTPSATFDGAVDEISVRDKALSDIRRAGDHSKCDDYPSLDAMDFCIDATPNVVTATAVLTLVASDDYHLHFTHMLAHDDPAITEPDAHYGTVTVKTHDASLYLQANLTWGAGAYAFPIASLFTKDRFSKRFTADPGDTSYLIVFSSNDLHGSAGYLKHLYIDNVHCEDVTDESAE